MLVWGGSNCWKKPMSESLFFRLLVSELVPEKLAPSWVAQSSSATKNHEISCPKLVINNGKGGIPRMCYTHLYKLSEFMATIPPRATNSSHGPRTTFHLPTMDLSELLLLFSWRVINCNHTIPYINQTTQDGPNGPRICPSC